MPNETQESFGTLGKGREEVRKIKTEVRKQVSGYILAALGFVAGLAWNDAIKSLIDYFFPASENGGIWIKFLYAALITLIVVVLAMYISRVFVKEEEKN